MPLESLGEHRLARLIDAGRGLLSELDLETVLDRLLMTAAELSGARYVALGVLDESRQELARFLTRGIDEETHRAIRDLPHWRGILGVLCTTRARCASTTRAEPVERQRFP
jgi:two-component system, NarL family, sensor histidine kinase DevS